MDVNKMMEMIGFMDPEGHVVEDAIKDIPEELIHRMYRLMVFTRLCNNKALSLQRQGRVGTLASVRGQEAANVGMGLAMKAGDWFLPSFREYGAQFARGVRAVDLFTYWSGDERGIKPPEDSRVLPICITVASQLSHAVGVAMQAKIRGEKIAVLSSSGDGSTSQGDFHEALNFAGVYKLPVVFAIQNNGWAISVPFEKQTATKTISQKAIAYGIDGARVDGNDIFAVYLTVKRLLDAARDDHRPALVELVTYRMDDHTTSDDAARYRKKEDVEAWAAKDPIERLRKYLTRKYDWTDKKEEELQTELTEEVEKTVAAFEAEPLPEPTDIFNYMYSEEPWHIREQKEEVKRTAGEASR
jgi:pyruvate dehydrogenase E1 component alpha subunit